MSGLKRSAPRKQGHTAKRIWSRLVDEHGAEVAQTTVRDYVRARKRQLGWPVGDVIVPQNCAWLFARASRRMRLLGPLPPPT